MNRPVKACRNLKPFPLECTWPHTMMKKVFFLMFVLVLFFGSGMGAIEKSPTAQIPTKWQWIRNGAKMKMQLAGQFLGGLLQALSNAANVGVAYNAYNGVIGFFKKADTFNDQFGNLSQDVRALIIVR